jgi:hypothetical protein
MKPSAPASDVTRRVLLSTAAPLPIPALLQIVPRSARPMMLVVHDDA